MVVSTYKVSLFSWFQGLFEACFSAYFCILCHLGGFEAGLEFLFRGKKNKALEIVSLKGFGKKLKRVPAV